MRIDLHTHSSASDGTQLPGEVIRSAAEAGLDLSTTEDILAALAVVGLVEPAGPGRWRAHLGLRGADATSALDRIHEALHGPGSGPAEAPLDHVPETPEPPRLVS